MGKTDVYKDRELAVATITPGGGTAMPYGFLTNVDSAEYSVLGVTNPVAGAFVLLGANRPKPTRMMKKESTYTVSCFASSAQIQSAIVAGWKVAKVGNRYRYSASNVFAGTTGPSVSLYVPVTVGSLTIKYAWKMPRYQAAKMTETDRTELGIILPTSDNDARDMIFGLNNLKPSRANRKIGTTGSASYSLTTFMDDTKTLTNWKKVSDTLIRGGKPEF